VESMAQKISKSSKTHLRKGDLVIVISGGNKKTRPLKGKVGKILRFVGSDRAHAVVEGLNMITKHQKAKGPGKPAAKIQREAPMHVSRLMYYVEKIKRPVRLKHTVLTDGTKVRGYKDPQSKEFVQIAD
jgi:large subunit ribosomal protein L24